jgi:hypothetical protein
MLFFILYIGTGLICLEVTSASESISDPLTIPAGSINVEIFTRQENYIAFRNH